MPKTPKHYSAASEGLAQGSYMAARVGFKHATLTEARNQTHP